MSAVALSGCEIRGVLRRHCARSLPSSGGQCSTGMLIQSFVADSSPVSRRCFSNGEISRGSDPAAGNAAAWRVLSRSRALSVARRHLGIDDELGLVGESAVDPATGLHCVVPLEAFGPIPASASFRQLAHHLGHGVRLAHGVHGAGYCGAAFNVFVRLEVSVVRLLHGGVRMVCPAAVVAAFAVDQLARRVALAGVRPASPSRHRRRWRRVLPRGLRVLEARRDDGLPRSLRPARGWVDEDARPRLRCKPGIAAVDCDPDVRLVDVLTAQVSLVGSHLVPEPQRPARSLRRLGARVWQRGGSERAGRPLWLAREPSDSVSVFGPSRIGSSLWKATVARGRVHIADGLVPFSPVQPLSTVGAGGDVCRGREGVQRIGEGEGGGSGGGE
eukprot:scaffold75889_cov66-Phaeocystis_antarctica.AAC.1